MGIRLKGTRGFSILGVYEGLVVEDHYHEFYIVGNPATRGVLHLPRPSGNCDGTGGDLDVHVSCFDLRTEKSVNIDRFPRGVFSDVSKPLPFWWNNCVAFGKIVGGELQVILVLEKQRGGE
ncbi:hypothetical protein TorRG33x02_022220 [Trema orientale]|uniref:Uncharacterized protein n=1 Tax=Trema orientale TaxID=63057 RepID=A0A2P5FVW1_TREOI|nr:hypothetical protein TorRG33x02_022220 [Trema orientale]